MKHKSDEPELQPLLTNESLIGVGNPSRSTGGSVVLDLTEQAKKHQLGSGAWIINEPEPSERNYTETYNISERLKSHPTFIGYQKKAKYTCIKPELIVSLPILCVIMIVVFLNLVVLLIYPFDDDVDFGAGTIQQWIVIIDIAAVELLVVWGIAKGIHLLLKFLVSASFLPAIEFILIQWNLYELAITGLIWGIICGMTWKPYTHNSADGSVS